jgi:Na+/melibiose symporter-like transporter
MPVALVMVVVAPQTPRLSARLGANRAVALGMSLAALGMLSFVWLDESTSYLQLIAGFSLTMLGIAMTMSPMTAAIMSAVPARRAGAGSSMNDATRELGSALGVAVLGSITATHYAHSVAPAANAALRGDAVKGATTSLSNALGAAQSLPPGPRGVLTEAANRAFLGGVHISVLIAAALAGSTALLVLRYLPRTLRHEAASPTELIELVDREDEAFVGVPVGEPV